MNMYIYTHKERGFTLFYAVLITSLLLSLGLAVFNITLKELILSSDARESQNAIYAADAALECALFWDHNTTPAFGFYGDSLASGITNYWRFDEGEGETAYDTGSADNDGMLLEDTSPSAEGLLPLWVDGVIGGALSFDGGNDYVGLEDAASYTGEFTVAMWVRPTFTTASQIILAGSAGRFGFTYTGAANEFRTAIAGSFLNIPFTSSLNGSWNHVVFRRESDNTAEIIINGGNEVLSAGNRAGDFNFSFIGQNSAGGANYMGDLDDIRVYNRALTDEEIEAMYNGEANNIFVEPVDQISFVSCAGVDISDPETGWNTDEGGEPIGWDTLIGVDSAVTTFDISLDSGRCAYVTVSKDISTTTIVARGYNSCAEGDLRRVERALRAEY